jgi:hypothetical protein
MPIEDHAYAVPSLLTEYASITLRTTTLTHAAQNQRILRRILSFCPSTFTHFTYPALKIPPEPNPCIYVGLVTLSPLSWRSEAFEIRGYFGK